MTNKHKPLNKMCTEICVKTEDSIRKLEEGETIQFDLSKIPRHVVNELLESMTAPLAKAYSDSEFVAKYKKWLAERNARE